MGGGGGGTSREITLAESNFVLKNMKNNKRPGSDGFTVEVLRLQLGSIVAKPLNDSFMGVIIPTETGSNNMCTKSRQTKRLNRQLEVSLIFESCLSSFSLSNLNPCMLSCPLSLRLLQLFTFRLPSVLTRQTLKSSECSSKACV